MNDNPASSYYAAPPPGEPLSPDPTAAPKQKMTKGKKWGIGVGAVLAIALIGSLAPRNSTVDPAAAPALPTVTATVTVTVTETATETVTTPGPTVTQTITAKAPGPSPTATASQKAAAPAPLKAPSPKPAYTPPKPANVYYANCTAARAAGAAPLYRGDPGYRSGLDRDGDGVACE
jgi:hypothetical protein